MTIKIADQELVQQLEQLAAAEHRSPEQIVADALRLYTSQARKISGIEFLQSIAGQGRSGEADIPARDEAVLTKLLASAPVLRDLTRILPGDASQAEYQRYLEQKYDLRD
jgi:predicted transcriptional regulator